jgi:hypothetical protein
LGFLGFVDAVAVSGCEVRLGTEVGEDGIGRVGIGYSSALA